MNEGFLSGSIQLFEYYRSLGTKAMMQVPDDKLRWSKDEDSNSISVIVKHLWGNMLSRWTDFLDSDGEKEWRERDAEFEDDLKDRIAIEQKWNEGWDCLMNTLRSLTPEDMEKTVYIRNKGHFVFEAIQRQLGHYAYHVGQLVFLAKDICGSEWESLSIPKGKSAEFNTERFSKPKHREHFTDEFLEEKD